MGWKEWLCEILGCKSDCKNSETALKLTQDDLNKCLENKQTWIDKVSELQKQNGNLQRLLDTYADGEPVPETGGRELSFSVLKNLLQGYCKNIWLSDNTYQPILYDSMKEFLAWDRTDRFKYVTNYFDCDDFSYRLMGIASTPAWAGIAFGIAWSKSHAFNIFVSSSRQIYIIEPQSDKIIKIEDAQGAYADLQLVVM